MKLLTLFVAHQKVIDRLSFIRAQQGGDYSARRKKAERQKMKLETRLTTKLFYVDLFEEWVAGLGQPDTE